LIIVIIISVEISFENLNPKYHVQVGALSEGRTIDTSIP